MAAIYSCLLFTFGCMVPKQVNVLLPAEFTVREPIKKLALGARTRSSGNEWNSWNGLFGSNDWTDQYGIKEAIKGLQGALDKTPRFEAVLLDSSFGEARRQSFPEPIRWNVVEHICRENGAQALIVLEIFDVDTRTIRRTREVLATDFEGNPITVPELELEEFVTVSIGWRMYDPAQKEIADEVILLDEESFLGKGYRETEARYNLPDPSEMVRRTAYEGGLSYGGRISPTWATVKRRYYGKHKEEQMMEIAGMQAEAGNWKDAAQKWKKIIYSTEDQTLAGKAAYNMAVASEIEGSLEAAKAWAEKSKDEFRNKKARSYLEVLEQRIKDEALIRKQLPEGQ